MTTCDCGHVQRMHAPVCTACGCTTFSGATDPVAATEAARDHREQHQRLLSTARRTLARGEYDLTLGAVAALLDLERNGVRR